MYLFSCVVSTHEQLVNLSGTVAWKNGYWPILDAANEFILKYKNVIIQFSLSLRSLSCLLGWSEDPGRDLPVRCVMGAKIPPTHQPMENYGHLCKMYNIKELILNDF